MDPTVEAALIAVVGTVVVATTGFLTTWAVTRRTNDAAAESALRARLWERQAAVYIEIIKAVEERKGERREWLRLISMGAPSGAYVESARWHALFPGLVAYIAPPSATHSTPRRRRTGTSAIYTRSVRPWPASTGRPP